VCSWASVSLLALLSLLLLPWLSGLLLELMSA
jgi:hypothetical protein